YEQAVALGRNLEWYQFGVAGLRVPQNVWANFVELAGVYICRMMPNYEEDETARRVVAAMRPPAPTYDQGAMRTCSSCHAFETQQWMPDAMWDEYEAKGIKFRCHKCRDAEKKARAEST